MMCLIGQKKVNVYHMCHHRVTRNCDLKKTPEENYDAYSFFIFSTVDLWKKSFKKTRENNVKNPNTCYYNYILLYQR